LAIISGVVMHGRTSMRRPLLAFLIVLSLPTLSLAWGDKGHKTVAEMAYGFLSDEARTQADALLGGRDEFIDAAVWADKIRFNRPETAPWHFVDIPFDSSGVYDPARDCANDDCAVARITEFAKKMADTRHRAATGACGKTQISDECSCSLNAMSSLNSRPKT
jgi:hypothetical protein